MTDGHIAVAISLLSVIGQAVNVWLKLSIKTEVSRSKQEIMAEVERKYVLDEVCKLRHHASN